MSGPVEPIRGMATGRGVEYYDANHRRVRPLRDGTGWAFFEESKSNGKQFADALAWARKSIRRGYIVIEPDEVTSGKAGARHLKALLQKLLIQGGNIKELKRTQEQRFRVYTVEGI